MIQTSGLQKARMLILTASILVLAACATGRPGGVAPPASISASANSAVPIVIDSINNGFGCANWAGSKLYLEGPEFRQALSEWFRQRGVRIVDSAADAQFQLSVIGSNPNIEYRLTNINTDELVWEYRERWPYRIDQLRCNTEARLHLERTSAALAAWDGETVVLLPPPPPELSPAERILEDAYPNTEVATLRMDLERRYAAGESPPDDIPDPNFHLVKCTGLPPTHSHIADYIAFGFGGELTIACEDTVAGKRLLERRRWECENQPTRACICGRRSVREFIDLIENLEAMTGPGSYFSAVQLGSGWLPFVAATDMQSRKRYDFDGNIGFEVCSHDGD